MTVSSADFTGRLQSLTPKPRKVLQLLLIGKTDDEIAAELQTSLQAVRKQVQNLCDHFGLKRQVNGVKRNRREDLIELVACHKPALTTEQATISPALSQPSLLAAKSRYTYQSWGEPNTSWGEVIDVSGFYGRSEELTQLERWIVQDQCRLVALLGIGGIGKTALSVKLVEQIQIQFESVIWRSLRHAVAVDTLLADLIRFLMNDADLELPKSVDSKISLLMDALRQQRCLIVLDGVEAVLNRERVGSYLEQHKGYGELFRRIGEERHQSCLLLTSREKPKEFSSREGQWMLVRSFTLLGLTDADAQAILEAKGLSGTPEEYRELNCRYAGNALNLKLAATAIQNLFSSRISEFLSQETLVFDGIHSVLEKQFDRLTDPEKAVIYWLAINRKPVSLSELREDILFARYRRNLLEPLQALERRSMLDTVIEKNASLFTLQPVVMEFVTLHLIESICDEIETENIDLLNSHALFKAQADDYVRESQQHFIFQTVVECLIDNLGSQKLEEQLKLILSKWQSQYPLEQGYAGGNIINLLLNLSQVTKTDLSGHDFSRLFIWQAYLQNTILQRVKFNYCNLEKSVFTEVLGDVLSVAFSADGTLLAAGDTEGKIHLWALTSGKKLAILKAHTGWVRSVAFHPDGQILASASDDRTIKLLDLSDVKAVRILRTLDGHKDWVRAVAFSPDGKLLASGGDDFTVKLWHVEAGYFRELKGHTGRVRSLAFSPTAQTLVSGGDDQDLRLWNIDSGELIDTFAGHTDRVRSVIFSPSGDTIASGGSDLVIRLWDVHSGKSTELPQAHSQRIRSIAFSPDGQMLASGSDDYTLRLWDVRSGKCLETLEGHANSIWSVAFSPQGSFFASGSDSQQVKLWDVEKRKCLKTFQGYANGIQSVAFAPQQQGTDEQRQDTPLSGYTLVSGGDDQAVRIWHLAADDRPTILEEHRGRIHSVAYSPDGELVASGSSDQTLKLWNAHTGEVIHTLQDHTYWVGAVAFSPDGRLLVSGGGERLILWCPLTGERLGELKGHQGKVWTIAFSPNGKLIASGGDDQTVRLWDVQTKTRFNKMSETHEHRVQSVAFSPDGTLLASSSDDQIIKLWEVLTGRCLGSLKDHKSGIQSVAFSPNGKWLASGSGDQTVKLWDVQTRECINTLSGQRGRVRSIAFSPDSRLLASGSQDATILIWDVESGQLLKQLSSERPYEGMEIHQVTGLSKAEREMLIALGAVDAVSH
jgi:WD40 repeat protein/DNA-binding CsgD family transcriptional regulator